MPWQNAYVESFGSRIRDELLSVELFSCLAEARVMVEDWRQDYNHYRPHSALGMQTPARFAREWKSTTTSSHQQRPPTLTRDGPMNGSGQARLEPLGPVEPHDAHRERRERRGAVPEGTPGAERPSPEPPGTAMEPNVQRMLNHMDQERSD